MHCQRNKKTEVGVINSKPVILLGNGFFELIGKGCFCNEIGDVFSKTLTLFLHSFYGQIHNLDFPVSFQTSIYLLKNRMFIVATHCIPTVLDGISFFHYISI